MTGIEPHCRDWHAVPAIAACGRCRCRDRRDRGSAPVPGHRSRQPRPPPRAHAGSGCGPIRGQGARRRPARSASAGRARLRAGSGPRAAADRTRSRPSSVGRMMRKAHAPVGEPEEGPGPFPVALHEAGLDEELQMAGDARLGLPQDVREIGDGKLTLGQQGQDPQARLLGGCPQDIQGQIQRWRRGVRHGQISLSHIKIYLYVFWNREQAEPYALSRRTLARPAAITSTKTAAATNHAESAMGSRLRTEAISRVTKVCRS